RVRAPRGPRINSGRPAHGAATFAVERWVPACAGTTRPIFLKNGRDSSTGWRRYRIREWLCLTAAGRPDAGMGDGAAHQPRAGLDLRVRVPDVEPGDAVCRAAAGAVAR